VEQSAGQGGQPVPEQSGGVVGTAKPQVVPVSDSGNSGGAEGTGKVASTKNAFTEAKRAELGLEEFCFLWHSRPLPTPIEVQEKASARACHPEAHCVFTCVIKTKT